MVWRTTQLLMESLEQLWDTCLQHCSECMADVLDSIFTILDWRLLRSPCDAPRASLAGFVDRVEHHIVYDPVGVPDDEVRCAKNACRIVAKGTCCVVYVHGSELTRVCVCTQPSPLGGKLLHCRRFG